MSDPSEVPVIIYHNHCNDGFTAAWVAWEHFGGKAELVPANYGEAPPDVEGRTVYIVDFSYPEDVLLDLAREAAETFVLDHHKTAQEALEAYVGYTPEYNLHVEFDMSRSGAMMTWNHFNPDFDAPALVKYVQDRDLWLKILPDSDAVSAYMKTIPRTIEAWYVAHDMFQTSFGTVVTAGKAVLRFQEKMTREMLVFKEPIEVRGHEVYICPAPNDLRSEIAHELCLGRAFGIGVYVDDNGDRVWSLRSEDGGADVSEIAKHFGGGGHKHAAGCKEPADAHHWWGWESMDEEQVPGTTSALSAKT